MRRRTFLRTASVTASAALTYARTPIPIAGSFAIPCPSPGFIQHLCFDSSGFYAGLFDRTRLQASLAKVSYSGQLIWTTDLPESRLVSCLEVLEDGSAVMICLHRSEWPERLSISATGSILNIQKLAVQPSQPQLVLLHNGTLLVLSKDGSLDAFSDGGKSRSRVLKLKEPFGATTAWKAGASRILLVNQHEAKIAWVDPASRNGDVHDLRSDALTQARSFFSHDARKADARGAFLLGAHCLPASGSLLGTINPVDRQAGLRICAFDRFGAQQYELRLQLLDSGKRPGLPRFMATAQENCFLVYSNGMVDAYAVKL